MHALLPLNCGCSSASVEQGVWLGSAWWVSRAIPLQAMGALQPAGWVGAARRQLQALLLIFLLAFSLLGLGSCLLSLGQGEGFGVAAPSGAMLTEGWELCCSGLSGVGGG